LLPPLKKGGRSTFCCLLGGKKNYFTEGKLGQHIIAKKGEGIFSPLIEKKVIRLHWGEGTTCFSLCE